MSILRTICKNVDITNLRSHCHMLRKRRGLARSQLSYIYVRDKSQNGPKVKHPVMSFHRKVIIYFSNQSLE